MKDFGELKQKIQECRYCQRQFGYEPHPVVWGKPNAKIMQISQAPSLNVHNTLKPFVDLIFNDQVFNGKPAYVLPHPSPLNRRWFKTYPEFEAKRVKEIRAVIKSLV